MTDVVDPYNTTSACHPNATCTVSSEGGNDTTYCTCTGDLIGDGVTDCQPPDEINDEPCASANACADNPFSFCNEDINRCVCQDGYFQASGVGGTCEPRNLCTEGNGENNDCDDEFATCIPLLGDVSRGFFTCACKSGYTTESGFAIGRKCVPRDECSDESHECSDFECCINLDPPLRYACNYLGTPDGVPIDPGPAPLPCTINIFNCGPDASCISESNTCACNPGHSGDPYSTCLDANLVTPNVIFATGGNSNGGFTIGRSGGVELGLRAKVNYDYRNVPGGRSVEFAFDGDRSYTFYAGAPPNGPSTFARWNFDITVNSDYDPVDLSGSKLSDFSYKLSLDIDPSTSITALEGDPINVDFSMLPSVILNHAIGDNATPNGRGNTAKGGQTLTYSNLIATNNVAQNLINYRLVLSLDTVNLQEPGNFTIDLEAMSRFRSFQNCLYCLD